VDTFIQIDISQKQINVLHFFTVISWKSVQLFRIMRTCVRTGTANSAQGWERT